MSARDLSELPSHARRICEVPRDVLEAFTLALVAVLDASEGQSEADTLAGVRQTVRRYDFAPMAFEDAETVEMPAVDLAAAVTDSRTD